MIYQPLSVWLFSIISLSLFITLLSLCLSLFFLSMSVSPEKAQSDFQGGICWPSVINKDLERQLQFLAGGWGLRASRQQRRVRTPQPDLQMHFNTHQWFSGSCTTLQILTGKHTLDLPQTDSCQRGSMAKQHSLYVFFSLCLVQIMVPSPWAGVYILCLMWIISLPSLHRKVQWLSKTKWYCKARLTVCKLQFVSLPSAFIYTQQEMWVIIAHRGAVNSPTVLLATPQIWWNVWWLGDFTALSWFLDPLQCLL